MRVAHLVPTLHPGGPEIGLVDLAAGARRIGLELAVVALATTADTTQLSALRRLGDPVAELGLAPWDPRAALRMARALRSRDVDLIHTHLPPADVIGAAAALRLRVPAVSTLHRIETMPADRLDRLRRTAKILARQRFMARTIAISAVQREWYRGIGGPEGDIVVVPDGVLDPGGADTPPNANGCARRSTCGRTRHSSSRPPRCAVTRVTSCCSTPSRRSGTARRSFSRSPGTARCGRGWSPGSRVGGLPEAVTALTGVLVPLAAAPIASAVVALSTDVPRRRRPGVAARARYLCDFEATGWARRLHGVYESVLAR